MCTRWVINSLRQSPWEGSCSSASQKIPHILLYQQFHYTFYKVLNLVSVWSHIYSFCHTLAPCSCSPIYIYFLQMVSFLQNFQPSVLCSSSFLCETYSPNLILLVLMLIIIFDEEHKLQNSWLCKLGPTSVAYLKYQAFALYYLFVG